MENTPLSPLLFNVVFGKDHWKALLVAKDKKLTQEEVYEITKTIMVLPESERLEVFQESTKKRWSGILFFCFGESASTAIQIAQKSKIPKNVVSEVLENFIKKEFPDNRIEKFKLVLDLLALGISPEVAETGLRAHFLLEVYKYLNIDTSSGVRFPFLHDTKRVLFQYSSYFKGRGDEIAGYKKQVSREPVEKMSAA